MGPAKKRRYPGEVKAPGTRKKTSSIYFCIFVQCPQVGSFKGGMSLTLVTFFFETSKLWANILALVGVECRKPMLEPEKAIGTN
jgi:hypothetical protein